MFLADISADTWIEISATDTEPIFSKANIWPIIGEKVDIGQYFGQYLSFVTDI
jgi:hypothetical protein